MAELERAEHQGRSMELEMRTAATPEQVWHAWADPEKVAQWFADSAEGWAHRGAAVTWIFDEFGYRLPYRVVESIPGECVVFGGEVAGRPPFLLEVRIRRDGGETVVRLVNSGFLAGDSFDEEYEGVVSGWSLALALLKYYLEHHYGEAKQQLLITRAADALDLAALPQWYTAPQRLNQWLTSEADVGEAGAPATLALRGGPRITGTLAAVTRREAAYLWEAQNIMIELKGWQAGPDRMLATRITGWSADEALLTTLRESCERALERLAAAAMSPL